MNEILEHISNREIATLLWLGIGLTWLSTKTSILKVILPLVRFTLQRPIRSLFATMFAYIAGMLWLLHLIGIWNISHLKETIVWGGAVGVLSVMEMARHERPYRFVREFMKEAVAITLLVEFLVGMSSFNILIELILVPTTTFFVLAYGFYQNDEKFKTAEKVMGWILIGIGIWLIGDAVIHVLRDLDKFATADTLISFSLPIIMTMLFSPFLIFFAIYVAYERVFRALRFIIPEDSLRSYAKLVCFSAFGLNLMLLKRWHGEVVRARPEDKAHLKETIREVLRVNKLENDPPPVDASDGWSPYLAKDFLCDPELAAGGYHRQADGLDDWSASSSHHKINTIYPYNQIVYSIYGTQDVAIRIRISLTIDQLEEFDTATSYFLERTRRLLKSAIPDGVDFEIAPDLTNGDEKRFPIGDDKEIIIELRDTSLNDFESRAMSFTLQKVGAKLSWEEPTTN